MGLIQCFVSFGNLLYLVILLAADKCKLIWKVSIPAFPYIVYQCTVMQKVEACENVVAAAVHECAVICRIMVFDWALACMCSAYNFREVYEYTEPPVLEVKSQWTFIEVQLFWKWEQRCSHSTWTFGHMYVCVVTAHETKGLQDWNSAGPKCPYNTTERLQELFHKIKGQWWHQDLPNYGTKLSMKSEEATINITPPTTETC